MSIIPMRYLLILLWFFPYCIQAQTTTFSKVFSNFPLNPENGWEIKEVDDGYLLISACDCEGGDPSKTCAGLTKLNLKGDIVWFRLLPFYPNRSNSMLIHKGLIYLTGGGTDKIVLYCLNMDGETLWTKAYGDPAKEEGNPLLAITNDEHLVFYATRQRTADKTKPFLFLFKTTISGDSLSDWTYGNQYGALVSRSLLLTPDQQVVFSYTFCPTLCFADRPGGISSTDTNGNLLWTTEFPFSYFPGTCDVAQPNPNTLVGKWYVKRSAPNTDPNPPALYYMDLQGKVQDIFVFDNLVLSDIYDINATLDGGIVGCGDRYESPTGGLRIPWLFRMDGNKKVLWEREYNDTTYAGGAKIAYNIIPTSDEGFILTGIVTNSMTGVRESHNWVLKVDADGCLSPGCQVTTIITAAEEPVFLEGIGIQAFPNPTTDWLRVRFPQDFNFGNEGTRLLLINNNGQTAKQAHTKGSDTDLDVSALPRGTYYLVVHRENSIILSKKITIQ